MLGNGAAFDGGVACIGALTAVGKPEGIWSMKDMADEGKSSQWLDQVKGGKPRRLGMVDYRQKEATEALSQTNYSTVSSTPSMSSIYFRTPSRQSSLLPQSYGILC